MIELDDICFSYDKETPALSHFSASVGKGESVLLSGKNGSGKSTLLKVINGLLLPEFGKYIFDGDIVNKKYLSDKKYSRELHKRIGFVFQNSDSQLFCSSVYDEIAFGPRQLNLRENEIKSRVEDLAVLFGIEKLFEKVPYHLSGGEKKKTAIAAVLALNPEVITLDEPFANLDSDTISVLNNILLKLKAAGKTIIIASHDMEIAEKITDREIKI